MSWFYKVWVALGGLFKAETIDDFAAEFRSNYCEDHPNFFEGSFKEALAYAKTSYKLLLIYLHAPDHSATPDFCQNVLGSPQVSELINENFVFWACSIKDIDGYRLCSDLEVTTYPFLAVFAPVNLKPTFLSRIEGPVPLDRFISRLEEVVENGSPLMVAAKVEEEEREQRRLQMEEQERAYNEALQRDQERERQRQQEEQERREAELARQRAQEEQEQKLRKREAEIQQKRESLPVEPDSSVKGTAKIRFRLPNGTQLERRFMREDFVSVLYDYIDSQEMDVWDRNLMATLQLQTNFPKKVLDPEQTVEEAALHPRANIFVYAVDP